MRENKWIYEVSAEFEDETTAREWAEWMKAEHMHDVIAAGAGSARLLRSGESAKVYIGQYEFASEAAMREYLEKQSPRLRAEAARRFDPQKIKYTRRTCEIVA